MEELNLYKVFNEFIDRYDFRPHQIPGYPDYYVDRFGKVYDKFGNDIPVVRRTDQYEYVNIHDQFGEKRTPLVHRLVAMTFDNAWFDDCVVHHVDENKYNNYEYNLECMSREDHGRLHNATRTDKIAICQVCGKPFLWTAIRQRWYYTDINRGKERFVTCSRACSAYIGRLVQLNRQFNPLPLTIKDVNE